MFARLAPLLSLLLGACAAPPPPPTAHAPAAAPTIAEPAPLGQLPTDVRPTRYALALDLDPEQERFSGTVEIAVVLDRARDRIWIHGQHLEVSAATVEPVGHARMDARWEQVDEGLAALALPSPAGPGEALIRVAWRASFEPQLVGAYRVAAAGRHHVFTQFEAIDARRAFPGFDDPGFKTPFAITLTIPAGDQAISNAPEAARTPLSDGRSEVRFAPTQPLPTYLVAFAVGRFDLVDAPPLGPNEVRHRPLPIRGVAVAGRGPQLAYALRHAGEAVERLERYFGIEYPYEKLDLVAVPDFGHYGMENAGAIFCREQGLLLDEKTAPTEQRRLYAGLLAHELSHQWFGDLVTLRWWDDTWLNEAFATFAGTKILSGWRPEYRAEVKSRDALHLAIKEDTLVSARQIRQPIAGAHDIENAFDSITYQKGSAVIGMFERWLGEETFRRGIHRFLEKHRFGSATTDDFLAALSETAARDVGTPFRTFLLQPGIPLVEARPVCEPGGAWLALRQSRFLPAGSDGERARTWKVPVCARYRIPGPGEASIRQSCVLLDGAEGRLPLDGCPSWVMPNADGAGYYLWSLPPEALAALRERTAYGQLSARERLALADSLRASFAAASLPADQVLAALEPLAAEEDPALAVRPARLLQMLHDDVVDPSLRLAVQSYVRALYLPAWRTLGWGPRPAAKASEDEERQLLRKLTIGLLAFVGRDPDLLREAARRGRAWLGTRAIDPTAVDPSLVEAALAAAVQTGDATLFDRLTERLFSTEDSLLRQRLLGALGSTHDPALAERARALALDPRLRQSERLFPIEAQLDQPETRDATWVWLERNLPAFAPLLPQNKAGRLPSTLRWFCDRPHAERAPALFGPLLPRLPGGPRNLAAAIEEVNLCAAAAAAQKQSAEAFFRRRK